MSSGFFPFQIHKSVSQVGFFGPRTFAPAVVPLPPISFNFNTGSGPGPIIGGPQNVGGQGWWDGATVFGIAAGNLLSAPNPPVMSGSGAAIHTFSNAGPGTGGLFPFAGNTWYLMSDPGLPQSAFNNIVITSSDFVGALTFFSAAALDFDPAFNSAGNPFSLWVWPATGPVLDPTDGAVTMNF